MKKNRVHASIPMRKKGLMLNISSLALALSFSPSLVADSLATGNTLIKNGSFEDYTINKNHGGWKEVTFTHWAGAGEAWNSQIGRPATDGEHKIELDVGRELNVLAQTVTTENRLEYALSLDAYARRANSSDFEIWVDDTKLETVKPTAEWKNYRFKFFGNGTAQKIQIKELDNQNNSLGTVIDNVSLLPTGQFDNRPPSITSTAKQTIAQYASYTFAPIVTDADNDRLTFSIENKPAWAAFNTTTGVLSGVPTELGNNADIKIIVTDGRLSTDLAPFAIEVTEAVDIAQRYGKATQPARNGYYWYSSPDKMIDGDDSTSNHTEGTPTKNWVQIELPSPTKIHQVMIKSRDSAAYRLNGAAVYISESPYTGTLDEAHRVGTLKGNSERQYLTFDQAKSGTYLIVKGKDSRHIHLATVEVYGAMPSAPMFTGSGYTTTIDRWKNKIESIFNVSATDYQQDTLSYAIEGDVPFTIDDKGDIRVANVLNNDAYTFDIVVSDGVDRTKQSMTVNIVNQAIVGTTFRSNDNRPELSGYLPNNYHDGDTLTVTIAGVSYAAIINADGTWTIADDSIETALSAGTYDVTLSINGEEIVYSNYFEIYRSMLQTSTQTLSMDTIDDVAVSVISHTETPLVKDERVRGSSIALKVENGVVTLENKSYREIRSLLGKYQDDNGNDVLVKLNFDQNILPYSTTILSDFANADYMSIVHTAGHFDMELSFGGKDCDINTPTDKTIYCTPTTRNDEIYSTRAAQTTLSEQQVYSVAMATYSHLYNSVDGLNTMKAWVEGSTYKGVDYTGSYQSAESYTEFEDDKMAYLNEKYFRVTMPNNHVKYSAMRFQYAAEGIGGGRSGNLLGTSSGGHFASSWEGSIKYDNNRLSTYDTIHHEAMHGIGFSHSSGMTYGWSHALKSAIKAFYTVGENPVVDVPKYVFETKHIEGGKLQITVHKTSDASEDQINIDLLSGTAVTNEQYHVEQGANDAHNQVTITLDDDLFTRFFIRVYGADSDELMSQLITPQDMTRTHLITNANTQKAYYAISHANWEKGAKALNLPLKTNEAQSVCKLWVGSSATIASQVDADKINSDYRLVIDNADWLPSKNLLGNRTVWYQYLAYDYSNGAYTKTWKDYNKSVNDDTLGILCVNDLQK